MAIPFEATLLTLTHSRVIQVLEFSSLELALAEAAASAAASLLAEPAAPELLA